MKKCSNLDHPPNISCLPLFTNIKYTARVSSPCLCLGGNNALWLNYSDRPALFTQCRWRGEGRAESLTGFVAWGWRWWVMRGNNANKSRGIKAATDTGELNDDRDWHWDIFMTSQDMACKLHHSVISGRISTLTWCIEFLINWISCCYDGELHGGLERLTGLTGAKVGRPSLWMAS